MRSSDSPRQGPLGAFLAGRRAQITLAEAGLPDPGTTRRVPGLRREEVAQLAGISTDYYTRLEQGRVRTASRPVLAAIGRALRLNDDQSHHLTQLAHPHREDPPADAEQYVSPQLERLLAHLVDTPALVLGRYLDILAWNRLATALLGDLAALEPRHRNYVRMTFLDPYLRSLLVDWEPRAQETVSALRIAAGLYCDHPRLRELVTELSAQDVQFRTWWTEHLVTMRASGSSRLDHPVAGRFSLDWKALIDAEDEEQVLVLLTPAAGAPDHEAIRRLDAWAEAQHLTHGNIRDPGAPRPRALGIRDTGTPRTRTSGT